ncbi:MAG: hypothetical protein GY811_10240, partial [Myxococcales bacterium]|nr:hypothetical protein [Myxococcales bacterium]
MDVRRTGTHPQGGPPTILAMHPEPRVRGALHRSFAGNSHFDVALVSTIEEARKHAVAARPGAVLMSIAEGALRWAGELRSRLIVPIVFCLSDTAQMSLCERARSQGLRHFIELPGDHPAAWARNAPRIISTLECAMRDHTARTKGLARSTVVMPAAPGDLKASRDGGEVPQGRQRRTTKVREVSEEELEATRRRPGTESDT